MKRLTIAVLFDGAGLARQGLEAAGHKCTGYEIDPAKHHLSKMVGSGNSILADVRDIDLSNYDAVWASPPCQDHSDQHITDVNEDRRDLLDWSLKLPHKILWVENVLSSRGKVQEFGNRYNAAQFLDLPVQRRRRMIGGRYTPPMIFREYKADYQEWRFHAPPAVIASEIGHGGISYFRKFSMWYLKYRKRVPTLEDMAKAQGFTIPSGWRQPMEGYTDSQWQAVLSQAIGNGVPVYMARAFGAVYGMAAENGFRQLSLFDVA